MSNRTAESYKAITLAWEQEKELVKKGKGTRNWTVKQQQDILEFGKAYDDDGKAFEGQHMKSAEKYPQYQSNPANIQFLTREEHFEAHNFNWQNPTNWYYDPITKVKLDFGDGDIIPCKVIELSNSVIKQEIKSNEYNMQNNSEKVFQNADDLNNIKPSFVNKKKRNLRIVEKVVSFGQEHPVVVKTLKGAGKIILTSFVASIASRNQDKTKNIENNEHHDETYIVDATKDISLQKLNDNFIENNINKNENNSQYTPNDVRPHQQYYHYKDGSKKLKDKSGYHRNGKK